MSSHKCMKCIHGSVCGDFEGSHSKNCEYFLPESEWISVKDRLPKESEVYWVNLHQEDEGGNVADFCIEAWYRVNPLLFTPKEVGWQLLNEWYEFSAQMRQYISHWMPLPSPPAEDNT